MPTPEARRGPGGGLSEDDRSTQSGDHLAAPQVVTLTLASVRDLATGLDSAASWLDSELAQAIVDHREDYGDDDTFGPPGHRVLTMTVREREVVQMRDWLRQAAALLAQIGSRP